ncbi:site-2 protease family protein [Tahibacter caeni]|uniref:site-2 protease family protein n=1 Tax=Tahibacter caeni TaxID=1453545 RepID=UPI0021493EC0|nr:site-2 protease family protein [Tahibacter caeni]
MTDHAALLDLAALVLAVFLLLQLQRLRALLSLVFAPARARRIAAPRIPEAIADLHARAAAELAALGFEGPQWFLVESVGGAMPVQPVAVWRQREEGDALWLFAPPGPQFANRLLSVFVRRLGDGRHCVSEAFDCYAEVCANAQVLGQTIAGADFAAQWKRHRDWAARQGAADTAGVDDAALEWQAGGLTEQRLASLQQRGKVYRDSSGLLRPRLGFAWTIYKAFWRQPKPPANTQPVPPARLAWLAGLAKRQTQLTVPRRVQAGLFAFSVALFLLLGGWIWGWRFAAILLVVVAIHEFGHYLAMRLSGYRNVQMLALPLVGGVTIGHEAKPDAARRAWMSLMGPLPGILIGWALLAYAFFNGGIAFGGAGLAVEAALVFLFVNYLNVLPVPPLDGAHVVQELLPVGSARLSAVFVAIASLLGAALAFWFGFLLLAFIALLQLPTVRSRWRLGSVLHALRNDPQMDKSQNEALRQRRVFDAFDRIAGTTALAPPRLALAAEALRSLDVAPMRLLQRVLVGGTYLALLAGPLAAAVIGFGVWQSMRTNDFDTTIQRGMQDRARLEADAAKLGLHALVSAVLAAEREDSAAAVLIPAGETEIAAAQARLGIALPDELAAFYRIVDGASSLGLAPLARVQRVADVRDLDLDSHAIDGKIPFYRLSRLQEVDTGADEGASVDLAPAQVGRFLLLGHDADLMTAVFYDVGEPPQNPGVRFYWLDFEGGSRAAPQLIDWLRQRWAMDAMYAEQRKRIDAARERAAAALAGQTPLQLLDALPRPPLWQRLLNPQLSRPGPAEESQIAAVAARFGPPLPDELAALYRRHDGLQAMQLLPLAQWQSVANLDAGIAELLRQRHAAVFAGDDATMLSACIVIGGFVGSADATKSASLRGVTTLWCPQAAAERRFLDLASGRAEADYTALLRDRVARLRAESDPYGE